MRRSQKKDEFSTRALAREPKRRPYDKPRVAFSGPIEVAAGCPTTKGFGEPDPCATNPYT